MPEIRVYESYREHTPWTKSKIFSPAKCVGSYKPTLEEIKEFMSKAIMQTFSSKEICLFKKEYDNKIRREKYLHIYLDDIRCESGK